jgi:hypothetical protein
LHGKGESLQQQENIDKKTWDKCKADLNHASEQAQDMLDAKLPCM